MANPQDTGTFEYWYTDRVRPRVAVPKTGNTGDFEKWYTDRVRPRVYVVAVVADLLVSISDSISISETKSLQELSGLGVLESVNVAESVSINLAVGGGLPDLGIELFRHIVVN